jgi:hypothetical protein
VVVLFRLFYIPNFMRGLFKKQLEIIEPRLDHFFITLNNDPESKVNLIIYDTKLPKVFMEE